MMLFSKCIKMDQKLLRFGDLQHAMKSHKLTV